MLEDITDTPSGGGNVIFLKGRFKSKTLNLYGLFIVMFSPGGHIESHNVVVSTYSNVFGLEPHESFDKYEESITNYRWKGNYNNSMTSSLLSQLETVSNDSFMLNQLYGFVNDYDYNHAEIFMFDMINRVIQDKNLILETGIQEVTRNDIVALKEQKKQKDEIKINQQSSSKSSIEEGATILTTSLILAPVRGKPLYDLKIGDKIMLKIEPATEQANYFIDYYNLRSDSRIKPIPGEVVDIKSESRNSPVEIMVKIDDGLYGKAIEDERQVKLRLYDQRYDGVYKNTMKKSAPPTTDSSPTYSELSGASTGTIILVSIFFFLLLIFLAIIYILL